MFWSKYDREAEGGFAFYLLIWFLKDAFVLAPGRIFASIFFFLQSFIGKFTHTPTCMSNSNVVDVGQSESVIVRKIFFFVPHRTHLLKP